MAPLDASPICVAPGAVVDVPVASHARDECPVHEFKPGTESLACPDCRCLVCEAPALRCAHWKPRNCFPWHCTARRPWRTDDQRPSGPASPVQPSFVCAAQLKSTYAWRWLPRCGPCPRDALSQCCLAFVCERELSFRWVYRTVPQRIAGAERPFLVLGGGLLAFENPCERFAIVATHIAAIPCHTGVKPGSNKAEGTTKNSICSYRPLWSLQLIVCSPGCSESWRQFLQGALPALQTRVARATDEEFERGDVDVLIVPSTLWCWEAFYDRPIFRLFVDDAQHALNEQLLGQLRPIGAFHTWILTSASTRTARVPVRGALELLGYGDVGEDGRDAALGRVGYRLVSRKRRRGVSEFP